MQQYSTEAECRDMIQIEFSSEEIQQLNYERYHHPHPRVQKKMEVVYLKSRELSHQEIRRLCQISKTTLVSYLRQYQQGGIEQLKQLNYKGKPSQLNEQVKTIEAYFQAHPPRKVAEAQAKIEELTGIKRNPTQIRAFLHRIGMRCRKVGFIPGKGSDPNKIEEQEVFRQSQLEPLLEEAKAGKRAVFFVDAAPQSPSGLFRIHLVFHSHLYPFPLWSQALQCLGCD